MQVSIRPLIESDAYTSVQWRNDAEVFKYTGNTYNHEIKIDSELEWIRKVIANPNDYRCAILAENVYVGNIYLTNVTDQSATYHIFIGDKNYWGKGIAKRASILILDYAFKVLHLHSVKLKVRNKNTSAYMLYIKLGFKTEKVDEEWTYMYINKDLYQQLPNPQNDTI